MQRGGAILLPPYSCLQRTVTSSPGANRGDRRARLSRTDEVFVPDRGGAGLTALVAVTRALRAPHGPFSPAALRLLRPRLAGQRCAGPGAGHGRGRTDAPRRSSRRGSSDCPRHTGSVTSVMRPSAVSASTARRQTPRGRAPGHRSPEVTGRWALRCRSAADMGGVVEPVLGKIAVAVDADVAGFVVGERESSGQGQQQRACRAYRHIGLLRLPGCHVVPSGRRATNHAPASSAVRWPCPGRKAHLF